MRYHFIAVRFTNNIVSPFKGSFCCLLSNIYHSLLFCHLAAVAMGPHEDTYSGMLTEQSMSGGRKWKATARRRA